MARGHGKNVKGADDTSFTRRARYDPTGQERAVRHLDVNNVRLNFLKQFFDMSHRRQRSSHGIPVKPKRRHRAKRVEIR